MPSDDGTEFMLLGYEDELVKMDGEWRFRSRRVAPLGSDRYLTTPSDLPALPKMMGVPDRHVPDRPVLRYTG